MSLKINVIQLCGSLLFCGWVANSAIAAEQRAYIGNIGKDAITTCTIEDNESPTLTDCRDHHDDTFASPIDIVTYPKANMAYVANWNSAMLSICATDDNGDLLNQPCQTLSIGDHRLNGLLLDTDHHSTKLYVMYMVSWSELSFIQIYDVAADGSLRELKKHHDYPAASGRIGVGPFPDFGSDNLGVYMAGQYNTISICDYIGPPTGCLYPSFTDSSIIYPRGGAMDPAVNYFYVANGNNTVSICELHQEAYTLYPCTTTVGADHMGQPTFQFGEAVNFMIREKDNYAFIPNAGNNTISICSVDPDTGAIGVCYTDTGADNFDEPSSIWIE